MRASELATLLRPYLLQASTAARPVYDVRDFGAIGDAVSDDTVAIQSAIDTAWSAGGGTVLFQNAHYILTAPLVIQRQVHMRGLGWGTWLEQTGNGSIISIDPTTTTGIYDLEIGNMRLTGNLTWDGLGYADANYGGDKVNGHGISFIRTAPAPAGGYSANINRFHDLWIYNIGADALHFESNSVQWLQYSIFESILCGFYTSDRDYVRGYGLYLNGGVSTNSFKQVHCWFTRKGWYLAPNEDNVFESCNIQGTNRWEDAVQHAVTLAGAGWGIALRNLYIESTSPSDSTRTSAAIYVGGYNASVEITGGLLGTFFKGIELAAVMSASIKDVTFHHAYQTAVTAIDATSSSLYAGVVNLGPCEVVGTGKAMVTFLDDPDRKVLGFRNWSSSGGKRFDLTNVNFEGVPWDVGTTPPSSLGLHYRGEIIWNTSPSHGGPAGWICTETSKTGQWSAFGLLNGDNIVRATISASAIPNNVATPVLTITTTNETGTADGGGYSCLLHVVALDGSATGANAASKAITCQFVRTMSGTPAGINSAVTVISTTATVATNAALRNVDSITVTVVETDEYTQTINVTIDRGAASDVAALKVTIGVEILSHSFTTRPNVAPFGQPAMKRHQGVPGMALGSRQGRGW